MVHDTSMKGNQQGSGAADMAQGHGPTRDGASERRAQVSIATTQAARALPASTRRALRRRFKLRRSAMRDHLQVPGHAQCATIEPRCSRTDKLTITLCCHSARVTLMPHITCSDASRTYNNYVFRGGALRQDQNGISPTTSA
jgi:hypothetical protein